MKKRYLMLIEIVASNTLLGCDKDEIEWFEREVLKNDLILHSNDLGSKISDVRTLAVKRIR